MTDLSARWRRIEELCHAALDRPPADRAALLDEQCANDKDLRIEVERLLAQESAAAGFLNVAAPGHEVSLSPANARHLTGRRLNALEIGELLGSGGMGDVYRAHDTLLGRDVAIKVLSREFVDNAEQLARFEREAQILASLNHPNIAQIYGLEHGEGMRAIVMELVHGTMLPGEPKDDDSVLRHSLGIARQVAAALEAAHEQGVIHRDLKPSNIKVRPDGVVKVLDFGLAKTVEATGYGAATDQEEAALPITRAGAILGTVAYMSPEQARGLTADRRCDLWAFGVLLYELLVGTPPFQRDTTADTIAALLKDEPDWRALPRNLPEPIRTLLRRCLQRDCAKRLDSATAVLLELDDALSSVSERRFSKRSVPSFRQLDLRHGSVLHAKFANSSRAVICSASRDAQQPQLYRVRADGRGSREIGVKADVLAVSTDDQLALLLEKGFPLIEHGIGILAQASLVAGSAPRELLRDVIDADWGPDGALAVLVQDSVNLTYRVEYPIGSVLHTAQHIRALSMCADGRTVAFVQGNESNRLSLLIGGWTEPTRMLTTGAIGGIGRSPNPREVLCTIRVSPHETALCAVSFDARRRELCRFDGAVALCDVSMDGTLLLRRRSFISPDQSKERQSIPGRSSSLAGRLFPRSEVTQLMVVDGLF